MKNKNLSRTEILRRIQSIQYELDEIMRGEKGLYSREETKVIVEKKKLLAINEKIEKIWRRI